jgi:hypothetical protein
MMELATSFAELAAAVVALCAVVIPLFKKTFRLTEV